MLMLDGRAQRSLKTCKDLLAELLSKLEKVGLDSKPPKPDKESRVAFRLDAQAKAGQLRGMAKHAKDVVKRMEKSPNKDCIQSALNHLSLFEDGVQSLASLFSQIGNESPDIEIVVKAYEDSDEFVSHCELFQPRQLGAALQLTYLVSKASCCCLYGKYEEFWRHFTSSNKSVDSLQNLLAKEEFEAAVLTEVENRLVMSFRATQAQHVAGIGAQLPESGPVREAHSLCQAMLIVAKEFPESTDFVPDSLSESIKMAADILGQAESEMSQLGQTIQKLQEISDTLAESQQSAGVSAVVRFFLQHPIGQSLYEHAYARVESGKQEAAMEEALDALEAALEKMIANSLNSSVGIIDEIFVPVRDLWQAAGKKLKSLKAKKKFARGTERAVPQMEKLETLFFQKLEEMSQTELSRNLSEVLTLCLFR